ncbi:MAG: hypothetical protein RMZ41_021535 [Nostoc sp. DedVER02]
MVSQRENSSQVTRSNWRAIYKLSGEYLESDVYDGLRLRKLNLKITFTNSAKVVL